MWIDVKDKLPEPNTKVLVVLDYTTFNRGKNVETANTHFTETYKEYGGPNALTGSGRLKGLYFSIPAIVCPGIVTHWMPLPEPPTK